MDAATQAAEVTEVEATAAEAIGRNSVQLNEASAAMCGGDFGGRLGGTATIHADVRVIYVTHRSLNEMTEERQFRPTFFYRLSVFPIDLPPQR